MDHLDTIYSQAGPCRNLDFGRSKFGSQSTEYLHLLKLQKICLEQNFFKDDPEILSQMLDVFNHDKECVKFEWMSSKRFYQIKQFINHYSFKYSDVRYMQSFIKKLNNRT